MKTEYRLKALDDFVCLGNTCPANCCCAAWTIAVEPEIYQRWHTVPDTGERARLLDAVTKSEQDGQPPLRMARSESGCCRLLTSDGLCSLQQRHGEALMPTVCRTYPRAWTQTPVHAVATASLSCPDIARRVLFGTGSGGIFHKSAHGTVAGVHGEHRIRLLLTELVDRVMAESKFTVATRAYYFADVIARLSRLSMRGELSPATLEAATAGYKSDLFRIGVAIKERRLPVDAPVAGSYWHMLSYNGARAGLLPEPPAEAAVLTAPRPESRADQARHYAAVHAAVLRLRTAARPLLKDYEPQFNRYLHAALVYNGFPLQPALDNHIVSLMRALVPVSLARLRLWLLAAGRTALSEDDVVETVYTVERRIAQSKWVLDILDRNPELLELDRYHAMLSEL